MFRLSGIFSIVMAIVLGALLFQTSQSVQRAERSLFESTKKLNSENESLRILTAEWDYLNRPERLEKLTLQNLDLDDVHANKVDFVQTVKKIPEPLSPVIPGIKPVNFSSVKAGSSTPGEPKTIQNSESDSFEEVIESAGGTP